MKSSPSSPSTCVWNCAARWLHQSNARRALAVISPYSEWWAAPCPPEMQAFFFVFTWFSLQGTRP
jgi:hypothetical protein